MEAVHEEARGRPIFVEEHSRRGRQAQPAEVVGEHPAVMRPRGRAELSIPKPNEEPIEIAVGERTRIAIAEEAKEAPNEAAKQVRPLLALHERFGLGRKRRVAPPATTMARIRRATPEPVEIAAEEPAIALLCRA